MAQWNHKYLEVNIGAGTTIQNQSPGRLIAKAITEIQDEVPNEVEAKQVLGTAGIQASIYSNKLLIEYDELLPSGGAESEVLQRDAAGDAVWGPVRAM